jgi:hypothetical protein
VCDTSGRIDVAPQVAVAAKQKVNRAAPPRLPVNATTQAITNRLSGASGVRL